MNEENNIPENTEEIRETPTNQTLAVENNTTSTSCKKSNCGMIVNIFLAIAIVILYILFFTSKNKQEIIQPVSIKTALSIAYVDSDTLWENYDFVKDTKKELDDLEAKLTNNYKAQAMAFKSEYDNYLKIGASLPLNEQKKREAALQQKQNSLMELEKSLGSQLTEEKQNKNIQLQDSIFAFIKRFNQSPKYSFILEKSRVSGILYANDSLNITKDVLKGLNEAYLKGKNK
ncbi:MAG: OmpH family outer membrane protein [Bacteroidales bacterium]